MTLALIGLIAPDMAHFHILPHWLEPWLFVFSGLTLGLSWWMILRDCRCACEHCGGGQTHKIQKIILGIISAIFVISLILHFLSHQH